MLWFERTAWVGSLFEVSKEKKLPLFQDFHEILFQGLKCLITRLVSWCRYSNDWNDIKINSRYYMSIDLSNKIHTRLTKFVCFNYGEFSEIAINKLKCYTRTEKKLYSIDNLLHVHTIATYFANGKCNTLSFE